jgi:hypothetical protein
LDDANVGHQMLKSLGWREGEGLGREGEGIREPVRARQAQEAGSKTGVGAEGGREGKRISTREVYDSRKAQMAVVRARFEAVAESEVG